MPCKYIEYLGITFIVLALILNPIIIEQLFSPDKRLDDPNLVKLIILEITFFWTGVLMVSPVFIRLLKILRIPPAIMVSAATILLFLITVEAISYMILVPLEDMYKTEWMPHLTQSEILGSVPLPNTTTNLIIDIRGKPLNNKSYTIDEYGRRFIEEKPGRPHLIFFGGSFVFGYGLHDNETLPYFLSEYTDYSVYNYAFSGYGTQQMLAHLERGDFCDEISVKEGYAIYVFIDHHIRRLIGDMRLVNMWAGTYPYYYLDGDEVRRDGSFSTGREGLTNFYRLLWTSNFLRLIGFNLPPESSDNTYFAFKVIEKSRDIYESKFNGTFYVLIHPVSNEYWDIDYLKELLEESNIDVLEYPIVYSEEYEIEDGHPNAKFNRILAQLIAEDLNKLPDRPELQQEY